MKRVGCLAALAVALTPSAADATTIKVETTVDEYGTGASCSLREAVSASGDDTAQGGCPAGGPLDTIELPAGTYRLTRTGPEILYSVGFNDLDVVAPLTIRHLGSGRAVIDGVANDRILETLAGPPGVSLVGLTLRNGSAGDGGAINNVGTALTIQNSTLSGNFADDGEGGAIYTEGSGAAVTLENVTLSGNRADESGGAFSSEGGQNQIRNTTITGNVADADASGSPTHGGGIFANVGITNIRDTIVAGNTDRTPTPLSSECSGQGLGSQGNNLIGDPGGCDFFGPHPSSDLLGADPKLGPLADNGGRAATHALRGGSEALGRGSGAGPATDQRGVPRAGAADIGAYERTLCARAVVNRVGTAGPDRLRGTAGPDGILGFAGNDRLRGLRGKDSLCGGSGRDRLLGGRGSDILLGQRGRDILLGGPGRDRLLGGPGRDLQVQ
jgi:CSLREA domain-containing protein